MYSVYVAIKEVNNKESLFVFCEYFYGNMGLSDVYGLHVPHFIVSAHAVWDLLWSGLSLDSVSIPQNLGLVSVWSCS